jgi:hypothetical protein
VIDWLADVHNPRAATRRDATCPIDCTEGTDSAYASVRPVTVCREVKENN